MADTRDQHRPPPPSGRLARLLVIALGLVGFVAAPAGAPASAAAASAAAASAVSQAVAPKAPASKAPASKAPASKAPASKAPARSRTTDRRHDGRTESAVAVAARHTTAAPAQAGHAALPASTVRIGPPSAWATRTERATACPAAAYRDAPRGRSPPASTGI